MKNQLDDNNFISGIHNYCDRWCERCQFTDRCRVFAMEQERGDVETDINSEGFVRTLSNLLAETKEMLSEMTEELGIDPNAISDEEYAEIRERETQHVEGDELMRLAKTYLPLAKPLLESDDEWSAKASD